MKEQLKRYGISLIASFGIFAILSFYLFLRRGYYDLFIVNKALAGTAFVLLAFVLLVGLLALSSLFFSSSFLILVLVVLHQKKQIKIVNE